jgi:hypothetical protein
MKVRDLSGKYHVLNLAKYVNNRRVNASQLHINAVSFLRLIYPALQILEEVHIPGENLYLDIYIPAMKTAVECQGAQHSEFNKFFHRRNPKNFANARARDERKKEWCDLNNIRIVYFYDGEDENQWQKKM